MPVGLVQEDAVVEVVTVMHWPIAIAEANSNGSSKSMRFKRVFGIIGISCTLGKT